MKTNIKTNGQTGVVVFGGLSKLGCLFHEPLNPGTVPVVHHNTFISFLLGRGFVKCKKRLTQPFSLVS